MISDTVKAENGYQAAFRSLQANVASGLPSWLLRLRQRAMDHFETLGCPGANDEEWKYTNVAPIARADFSPVVALSDAPRALTGKEIAAFTYAEALYNKLVFVNGLLRLDLSSLSDTAELIAIGLDQAAVDQIQPAAEMKRNPPPPEPLA